MARILVLLAACAAARSAAARAVLHATRPPSASAASAPSSPQPPEQIRLAYTKVDTEMGVHWATSNLTTDDYQGVVEWGPAPDKLSFSAPASLQLNYTAFAIKSPSLHFAVMTSLPHQTRTFYRVGSVTQGFSPVLSFTSAPARGSKSAYPFAFAAFGDMGISFSNYTAALLAQMALDGELDMIVHAGDISYADNRARINNGTIYEGVLNQFYNEVQNATSLLPYMLSSGNHEAILDFLAYRTRVAPTMPLADPSTPFWYSLDVGPVHFTAFDYDQPWAVGSAQYDFVSSDLAAVDRAATPWVIAFNHFPLLCSNYFFCLPSAEPFRAVYEPLFNAPATKVDFHLAGHVHASEAIYPSLNGTVTQTSFENVTEMLHLLVGNAGDEEINCCSDWAKPAPAYSAFRDDIYVPDGGYFGFTRVTLQNDTHAHVEFFDAVNASVAYEYWMSRLAPTVGA